ncbi:MAG: DUF1836 domain-containing protein [Oscillospiraceae bacterium]
MQNKSFPPESYATTPIPLSDLPEIALYMDQIITVFEQKLSENKRYDTDKIITKTMINNYSKDRILNPIKGKKYSKEHIIQMFMIYHLKQVLSMTDIKKIFQNNQQHSVNLEDAYMQYQLKMQQQQPAIQAIMNGILQDNISKNQQNTVELTLIFSDISNQFKRMAENLIDWTYEQEVAQIKKIPNSSKKTK